MVQDKKKVTPVNKTNEATKNLDNRKGQAHTNEKDSTRAGSMKDQNHSRDKDINAKRDINTRKWLTLTSVQKITFLYASKKEILKVKVCPNKKLKQLLLFDNVINHGIGVNEEGLNSINPSSFSTKLNKNTYIYLMKVLPNYKLPSFQLGNIEVVTPVAHAAVASKLVTRNFHLEKNHLLNFNIFSIIPGWNILCNTSFNTAFSQTDVIGRMAYENKFVTKHFQNFFKRIMNSTNQCAT